MWLSSHPPERVRARRLATASDADLLTAADDPRLRRLAVRPHALTDYERLQQEVSDDDDDDSGTGNAEK